MAWTTTDRDRVKAAIASGELIVQMSDGRRIQYRSIDELKSALMMINDEIAASSGTKPVVQFLTYTGSGLT